MKKKIFIITIVLVLSMIISSCGKLNRIQESDSSQNDMQNNDGVDIKAELNIPLTKFKTLDPLKTNNFTYYNFSKLIYESLFEFDENLEAVPLLVEKYNIKDEGRTIELELKDNIYWHNGDKLTTDDIEFTIERLKSLEEESIHTNMILSALGSFNSFSIRNGINTKIVDERRIEIIYDEIYGNNLESLTFPIINKSSYDINDDYVPLGTGPFIYIDYNSSQGVTLVKNDNYWNGEVNISKINGRVFENEDSILKAFKDGRVDFAYSMGVNLEEYEKSPHLDILEYVSPEYEFLAYNFKNQLLNGEDGKKIRKAIYYGIDRQKIIEEIYLGHATQVDTPLYPNSYLTENVTNTYGYNAEKARDLLRAAGFNKLDSDEILNDNLGRRLSFNLITNSSNTFRRKTAEIIKTDLKEIGIEIVLEYPRVDLQNLDSKEIDDEWTSLNKSIKGGKYDLALLGWELSVVPDMSFMFHSSFINSGSNFIGYDNEKMDGLLEDIYFKSKEEKINISEELQNHIMEDLPYASLLFRNKGLLLNGDIEGPIKPTFFNLYRNIEKCKIVKDKR